MTAISETTESSLAERLTALTRDLILIRSTHTHPEERRRAFGFLRNHLDPLPGIKTESHFCDGFESLVARPADAVMPEILFCAHIDVIEHPHQETYDSRIENGRIVGPGAGDMKGSLACLLDLFVRLHHATPGLPLALAVTSDEELGGECGFRHLFDDIGLRCGVALLPDGGAPNRVTIEEKGILHLVLKKRGRAGHAARPWLADNPLLPMMRQVERLHEHFRSLGPDTPPAIDGAHWFPTCAPTIVRTDNDAINRIPDLVEAVLDIRFPRPETVASIVERVRSQLDDDTEMEVVISAEPSHLAPDPRFLAITARITGLPVQRVRTSGGSDARFIAAHNIPVLVSRPAVGNLHATDEWIDIASMVTHYRICETYVRERLGIG